MNQDCIFCKIAAKQIPSQIIYEDEYILAFPDIQPQAPVHFLVIPKKHIESLLEAQPEDSELFGHVMSILPEIARQANLAEDGFRVVINTKHNGGQTVPHLHWHILGGRFMTWPPG